MMELEADLEYQVDDNISTLFEFDLATELFRSTRAYQTEIDKNNILLFSPDVLGLPVLVKPIVGNLLDAFQNGLSVGEALTSYSWPWALEDSLSIISFLEERGFLNSAPTPTRYTAEEFSDDDPYGISIWLHINNHCNLDCGYCFVDKFQSTMTDETISESVAQIVKTVTKRGIKGVNLKFAGGEPVLSLPAIERFTEKLEHGLQSTDARLSIAILTNGTVVTEKLLNFVKRKRATVAISLDGYGSESHDIFRVYKRSRKGSWEKIVKNIKVLEENGIRPAINATISEQSCDTLPELVHWIVKNGYRTRLGVVRQPNGSWSGDKDRRPEYKLLTDKLIKAFEAAFSLLEHPDYNINLATGFNICELHFNRPSYTATCGIGRSHIVIQDDGKIASCPMTIRQNAVIPAGDLVASARETIPLWSSASRNDSSEKNCLDCQWFPVCTSGCPVTNERIKGTPFTISPLHDFYDYVIPRYLQFFGKKLLQTAKKEQLSNYLILDSSVV